MSRIQSVCLHQQVVGLRASANRWVRIVAVGILGLSLGLVPFNSATATPLNILYYGNSFTLGFGGTETVPDLVSDIAIAAGQDAPNFVDASVDNLTLADHLAVNTGVISSSLAPGQNWDYVVLQDFSTEPTHLGNLTQHRASAVGLYQAVAGYSPNVAPVLFETWARAPGFPFYTGPTPDFANPAQMQAEVRNGYNLSAHDINVAAGSNIAQIAPVGDAFEALNFDPNLYDADLYHAQNRGSLLAALVIYTTIYGPYDTNIDLTSILMNLGLAPEVGPQLELVVAGLSATPEPSSLALLGMAVAGLAFWQRRRFVRS